MPLRNSKKQIKICLKCNSFYSKCTFINKILKSALYSIDVLFVFLERGGRLIFWLREERIKLSTIAFGPRFHSQMMAMMHMHIMHFLRSTQIYQLIAGVTKELPSTEGLKHLEMRHITRRDQANASGNDLKQANDGHLPALARENQAKLFYVAVFCHFPQRCPQDSPLTFLGVPFLCCWTRE